MAYFARAYVGGITAGTLVSDITDPSATSMSIVVTDTAKWDNLIAANVSASCVIAIDYGTKSEEKVLVGAGKISRSGTTVTISSMSRGYDGSTAQTHSASAAGPVVPVAGAIDFSDANTAVLNTVGKVAAAGDLLVGTGAGAMTNLPVGDPGTILQGGSTPTWKAAGTSGQYLQSTGSGVSWVSPIPSSARFDNSAASSAQTISLSAGSTPPAVQTVTTSLNGASTGVNPPTIASNVVTVNRSGLYEIAYKVCIQNNSNIGGTTGNAVAWRAQLTVPNYAGTDFDSHLGAFYAMDPAYDQISTVTVTVPINASGSYKTITPQINFIGQYLGTAQTVTVAKALTKTSLMVTWLGPTS